MMFKGKVGMFVMVAFKVAGLELPQLLVAVTETVPFLSPEMTVIVLFVDAPDQPGGKFQL
jgi:hypothetical protein